MWWSLIWSKIKDFVAPVIGVLAAIGALLYAGKRQGRIEAQRDAAISEIEARNRADEAAANAARDGAHRRLSDGRF